MATQYNRITSKGTYNCELCGKLTRDTGHGEADINNGYCLKCLYGCYLENAESDHGIDSPEYASALEEYNWACKK